MPDPREIPPPWAPDTSTSPDARRTGKCFSNRPDGLPYKRGRARTCSMLCGPAKLISSWRVLKRHLRPEAALGFLCSSGAVINLIISEIADFKLKSPLSTLEFRFISARPVQFSYLCYKLLQSGLISCSNKAVCLGSFSQCQS